MNDTCQTYQNINSVDLIFIMNSISDYQCNNIREPRFIQLSTLSKEPLKDEASKLLLNILPEFITVMGLNIRWSEDIAANQLVISHFDFIEAE